MYTKKLRHGDMILLKLNNINKNLHSKKINKIVVGLGEVTGHSHDVIPCEGTDLILHSDDDKIMTMTNEEIATMENLIFEVIGGDAVISHDEHDELLLDEGLWMRCFQVEYNPFKEIIEIVKD